MHTETSRNGRTSWRPFWLLGLILWCGLHTAVLTARSGQHWVATWSAAIHQPSPGPPGLTNTGFTDQTLRQVVHTSVGGDRVRIRLSTYGAGPLVVGAAHVALRAAGPEIVPASDRELRFGGQPSITIPPGAVVVSDPVALDVPPLADLAVSLFLPGSTGPAAWHFAALETTYVSPFGDFSDSIALPVASTVDAWFWLAGVEVTASAQTGVVVAFGDSVTDGTQSTPGTNNRWPDHLARRLMARPGNHQAGVLNEGLAGNRLLHDGLGPSGLARFDASVSIQTGVTHVIVLLGNNDLVLGELLFPSERVTVDQMIQGHRQLIARARARGLKIYGGTLTPLRGAIPDFVFAIVEPERQAINAWVRTSGEYDGVVDFDAVVRDPAAPSQIRPAYDSGDHLHPNDDGYAAMGRAIALKLVK